MLTWIVDLISGLVSAIPEDVWLVIIGIGAALFMIAGIGFWKFIKLIFMLVIAYALLAFLAWVLPDWIETLLVVGIIGASIWATH